ncbi:MAG TPA: tRNA (N(6)-L-threonylcarbamoyladenosine(37)-C(2))-methylthiotransferase MtaB [Acidobacteriaceae bacterium]|nr:tRNA (N(6)-L-threonylcarbamoyladenosine(37)-C(2))-methylthiotransferase MtaB [Acidobacteriaceae bacterium]
MENFGCRTNQSDGDSIAAAMECLGAEPAPSQDADVVVVNTCSVTAEAEREARAYIRRAQRLSPGARVVVTGCYAQRASQEIAALDGVYAVVENSQKHRAAEVSLRQAFPAQVLKTPDLVPLTSITGMPVQPGEMAGASPLVIGSETFAHTDILLPSFPASVMQRMQTGAGNRTRPSLKIQDGCGNRCTFCIIPETRGNSRSLPPKQVLHAVQEFIAAGGQELVLTGINLGRWGRDLAPQSRFEDLLSEIFETTALTRLRISSVEPMDWTDRMNALLRRWGTGTHPRLARHVHLPLQSGSDAILRKMHRRYRPWHYAERLASVRSASPEAAIGADVMVGFPGETDRLFQESLDFISAQPFTYLHLFPFSARPGTPGRELHRRQPVPGEAVKARMSALRSLIEEKNLAFRASSVHRALSVLTLILNGEKPQQTAALSDNFIPVEVEGAWPPNTLLTTRIFGVSEHGLQGSMPPESLAQRSTVQPAQHPSSLLGANPKCYTHEASRSLAHLEAAHR